MTADDDFFVRFWGVRGSIACATADVAKYGGNTSSLEVRCGGRLLMFDVGTGSRYLGKALAAAGTIDADMFLTHTHFDHVSGLPFFAPLFRPGNHIRIWAGHLGTEYTIFRVLNEMMIAPLFPVPLDIFNARLEYNDFTAGETLNPADGIVVATAPLNHPNGATGYRVEYGGRAICYVTDTEHKPGAPDGNILRLIQGADIVIYDATYDDSEFPERVGWGHSTWQEGLRLCDAAAVKTYVIFHHDPDSDDDRMDQIAAQAERMRPGTVVAREGMVLRP